MQWATRHAEQRVKRCQNAKREGEEEEKEKEEEEERHLLVNGTARTNIETPSSTSRRVIARAQAVPGVIHHF